MATSGRRNPNLRNQFRVLVTVEPRSYRETIASTLQSLRPDVRVRVAEPAALEIEVERFIPHLVVCSHATAAVERRVPAWVELYKEHGSPPVISVRGWRSALDGMGLDDLLSVVDRTQSLCEAS